MSDTTKIERLLVQLKAGDKQVTNELFRFAENRMRILASQMLKNDRVKRWENTDDLLQAAMLKLHKALAATQPDTIGGFYGLAALQVRRALTDLGRKYLGKRGLGTHHHTDKQPAHEAGGTLNKLTYKPDSPEEWAKYFKAIDTLPEVEQQAVDLTWINGLTKSHAADIMGLSEGEIKEILVSAKITLKKVMTKRTKD